MPKTVLFLALLLGAGCSAPTPSAGKKAEAPVLPAKITQFYTSTAKPARGEEVQLCYGVENATAVWISPPRQDLLPALAHCFTVTPSESTTYQLTAQGAGGQNVTQDLTVTVGAPRVHISEVRVDTLDAKAGETIRLCYIVANAVAVKIDPIGFKGNTSRRACATDTPKRTTTYTVTAFGADGETDSEKVTVKVH